MPELPELEVMRENLQAKIKGKRIRKITIVKPYILKNYLDECLEGERIKDIQRRGKFLIIELTSHRIIIHLMLRGSIKYSLPAPRVKKSTAASIEFDDGTVLELSEAGHKKMMSLYVLPRHEMVNYVEDLGIDPLSSSFTPARLKTILHQEPQQLKTLLRNQRKISGIGNAYADEILWKAQISPFKSSTKLTSKEVQALHKGITETLRWAIAQIKERGTSEKRDFLNIHQKQNLPCPRCNNPVHRVSFSRFETFYCPRCQTKGRVLKDRRMSKLFR
jgi:formamidopyrimidine-DNA glycosylase